MQTLPTELDFTKLAEHQTRLKGTLPLRTMSRLKNLLADSEGEVTIEADFDRDLQHKSFLDLKINTCLVLQCQRCLENFEFPMSIQVLLTPIFDQQVSQSLQSYEPLMVIEGEPVILQNIVEDEILLNLPLVPKHPKNVCPVVLSSDEEKPVESPFAVLSKLKINREE